MNKVFGELKVRCRFSTVGVGAPNHAMFKGQLYTFLLKSITIFTEKDFSGIVFILLGIHVFFQTIVIYMYSTSQGSAVVLCHMTKALEYL